MEPPWWPSVCSWPGAIGVGGDTYGVVLTPLLLHRLPHDIRLEWARVGEGKEGDLSILLDFIYAEIRRRERSQTFDSFQPGIQLQGRKDRVFSSPQSCEIKPKAHATPSVAAFVASENPYKRCAFCPGEHYSDQCSQIKDLDLDSNGRDAASSEPKIAPCRAVDFWDAFLYKSSLSNYNYGIVWSWIEMKLGNQLHKKSNYSFPKVRIRAGIVASAIEVRSRFCCVSLFRAIRSCEPYVDKVRL